MSDNRNRTRCRQISFRCTSEEAATIEQKVHESRMSKTDYLIRTLSEREINVYPGLENVLSELKKQGVNLNQALRYTHHDQSKLPELREAIKNCNTFYSRCLQLWEEEKNMPNFQVKKVKEDQ